jgi:mannose-6-phosphate isomerase-like protein (cupin superfamily)
MESPKVQLIKLPRQGEGDAPHRLVEERGELAILHPHGPVFNPIYLDLRSGDGFFRGGHYHRTKTENFYVIDGNCLIRLVDIDTGERETVELRPGDLITISPRCAHLMEAVEFCRIVEFSLEAVEYSRDTVPFDFP